SAPPGADPAAGEAFASVDFDAGAGAGVTRGAGVAGSPGAAGDASVEADEGSDAGGDTGSDAGADAFGDSRPPAAKNPDFSQAGSVPSTSVTQSQQSRTAIRDVVMNAPACMQGYVS